MEKEEIKQAYLEAMQEDRWNRERTPSNWEKIPIVQRTLKYIAFCLFGFMGLIVVAQIGAITGNDRLRNKAMVLIERMIEIALTIFVDGLFYLSSILERVLDEALKLIGG